MEVGQAVLALDLVNPQLDLAECVVLILLQIGERNLEDPSLQRVVGVLETGRPVDKSLADTGDMLDFRHRDISWMISVRIGFSYSRMLKGAGAWKGNVHVSNRCPQASQVRHRNSP